MVLLSKLSGRPFSSWHKLSKFAQGENLATFQKTRSRDAKLGEFIQQESRDLPKIDFSKYAGVQHQDLVKNLEEFYHNQLRFYESLPSGVQEVDAAARTKMVADMQQLAEKSVEESRQKCDNGAAALWISFNNPNLAEEVSTNEWLDVDQKAAAYVERYQYYSNHLNILAEDPESPEYEEKQRKIMDKKWENFDGHAQDPANNKLLSQKPKSEFYNSYRGVFFEHMMYFLLKSGYPARMFPELLSHADFCRIYQAKDRIVRVLQSRRRQLEEDQLLTGPVGLDLCPEYKLRDDTTEDEVHKIVARENERVLEQTGQLMEDYQFLCYPFVPLLSVPSAAQRAALGAGKFYRLGEAQPLFFLADNPKSVQPEEAFENQLQYLKGQGVNLRLSYQLFNQEGYKLIGSRCQEAGWFGTPEEPMAAAFLRRLGDSPLKPVFSDYVSELQAAIQSKVEVVDLEAHFQKQV